MTSISSCTAFSLLTLAPAIALFVCTPPPKAPAPVLQQKSPTVAGPAATDSVRSQAPAPAPVARAETPSPFLEVPQWPGHQFVLLRKNAMFGKFGYEFYDSPRLGTETAPARVKIALKNHRLRADLFAGRALTAVSVQTRRDSQFLVAFTLDTLGDTAWGVTRDGAIEGLALLDDLAAARKRWAGTTVYSRRRLIDVYDSSTSTFSSIKVSISEPLKVTDVAWGRTPLPPKPVWIVVQRADGVRGLIPVNMSWTNVLSSKRRSGMPWEDDLLGEDPRKTHRWDDAVWETIDNHNVIPGMTREQARLSWGDPKEQRDSTAADGRKIAVWRYDAGTLVFPGDSLVKTEVVGQ